MPIQEKYITYTKLLLSALLWGGTFTAAKILSTSLHPFCAAFIRFSIASFFLLFILIYQNKSFKIPKPSKLIPIFILGFSGIFAYNFCFFSGLKYIEAGRASVIVANNPIFIALFSFFLFKEQMNFTKISGIIISVLGALLVITKGDIFSILNTPPGIGELFILGTVASWVVYSLVGKISLNDFTPLETVTYSVIGGTILLFIPALNHGLLSQIFKISPIHWAALFYLGFFGTVTAFVFYYQGIQAIGPTRAGLFINFVPISGVLISCFLLKEEITPSLFAGLILVSFGVYQTNKQHKENLQTAHIDAQENT